MLSWAFAGRSGSSAVLIDQPGISTVDRGGHVDRLARIVQRRAQGTALMRAVVIEVALVLGQDLKGVIIRLGFVTWADALSYVVHPRRLW
ncbi:MAG: hypothetical protein ACJ72W_08135 [Actinoallomurus sp.]